MPFDLQLPPPRTAHLARALQRELRSAILGGRLADGFELPSSRTLAQALAIGRNTVIAAYERLVAEGHARALPGARLRVVGPRQAPGSGRAARAQAPTLRHLDARLAPAWRSAPPAVAASNVSPQAFRTGVPDHRHFDHATWRRLLARAQREAARQPFLYGPAQGLWALREAIGGHIAFTRAVACSADDLLVTAGAQQAFDLLARVLVTPGRTRVAVEDPGYPPARAAFLAAGARLVPVPVDDNGLRVDRVPDGVRVILVTPSHQWPTGAVMSGARRRALLQRARAIGAVVIEDDYDGEFLFGAQAPDALQTLDDDGRVFYVGTFSKCLFPTLRQGFLVAPPWALGALVEARHAADSHGDSVTQAALAAFIAEGHLARHIRRMRPIYAARHHALAAALQAHAGRWVRVLPGEAGLSLAVQLHDAAHQNALRAAAAEHLPGALPLAACTLGRRPRAGCLIGYGAADLTALQAAAKALGRALDRLVPIRPQAGSTPSA